MARSLDELIEFLLEEVTFGGESGLTFTQIAALVKQFYNPVSNNTNQAVDEHDESSLTPLITSVVDRPFLSKVWLWLARHPDVSIGQNKQHNGQSLDDVEQLYPGFISLALVDSNTDGTIPLTGNVDPQTYDQSLPSTNQNIAHQSGGPRFYVTEERMWIAVCGHLPDLTRVFASEWALLQTIAASKKEGILQGDLIRISGQDKRSVPKRTDALHEKGYIVKKTIYLRGNKTSRLCLRRFADRNQLDQDGAPSTRDQLTVRHLVRQLFDLLRNSPLIPHEDLEDALAMKSSGRALVLSRLIRHLGKLGCLKRVKTAFGPSARSKDLRICIQYLKEPVEEEWDIQSGQDLDLDQPVEMLSSIYETEANQSDALGTEEDRRNDFEENEHLEQTPAEESASNRSRKFVPQWNPDRTLANVLLEAAHEMSDNGLRNTIARNIITGPFIKRTLESLLVKLSNRSLQAQPTSLRHLAILRVHNFQNGITQYLHYPFDVFAQMVDAGQGRWQNISGGEQFLKELQKPQKDATNTNESVAVDNFGFATRSKPLLQARDGETTMSQLIQDAKVKDIQMRTGEPFLQTTPDGSVGIAFYDVRERTSKVKKKTHQIANPSPSSTLLAAGEADQQSQANLAGEASGAPKSVQGRIIKGRPRKFARGTEKFWRDTFALIVQERDPNHLKKHGKTGLMEDPGALQVFRQRPTDFDETVVKALELGLPLPSRASDISQDWVNGINKFVNRSRSGVYITPVGYQPRSRGKVSQHFVLRSTRLAEVDFFDKSVRWPWQLISSTSAHSFRHHKFYPQLGASPRAADDQEPRAKKSSQFVLSNDTNAGPLRGLFFENTQPDASMLHTISFSEILHPPKFISGLGIGEASDDTESDPELPRTLDRASENNFDHIRHQESDLRTAQHINEPDTSPVAVKPASVPSTRSNRKRKLTQKAVENLEARNVRPKNAESTARVVSNYIAIANVPTVDAPALETYETITRSDPSDTNRLPSESIPNPSSFNELMTDNVQMNSNNSGPESTILVENIEDDAEEQAAAAVSLKNTTNITSISQVNSDADDMPLFQNVEPTTTHSTQDVCVAENDINQGSEFARNESNADVISQVPNLDSATVENDGATEFYQVQTIVGRPLLATPKGRKRSRTAAEDSQYIPDLEQQPQTSPASKRPKADNGYEITRAHVSKLCRILVLELVGLCSGIAPNVPWTLRRAMVTRWQEAGVKADQLTAKNVRASVKALCESGKLKQIGFAFRGKNGVMLKMSIIALRGTDAVSPAVLDLQNKMKEMEPADYMPPELEVESKRAPSELNKKRYTKEVQQRESRDDNVDEHTTPKTKRRRSTKTGKQSAQNKSIDTSNKQQEPLSTAEPRLPSASPSPEPLCSMNIGFLTLKIPRLKELNLPAASRPTYQLPSAHIQSGSGSSVRLPTTAQHTLKHARRTGAPRRGRTARFDPKTHKLIWKKPKKFKVPMCLDEIPNIRLSRDESAFTLDHDRGLARFDAEVDCVAAWEESSPDFFEEVRTEKPVLINHTVELEHFQECSYPSIVTFKALIRFDQDTGEEIEANFPETETWQPFVVALRVQDDQSDLPIPKLKVRRKRRSTRPKADTLENADEDGEYVMRRVKRQKQGVPNPRSRRSLHSMIVDDEIDPSTYQPLRRNRVTQLLRHMTEEEKYAVVVAVVIVRTIVGGIEKFIDWRLVCRLLPNMEEHIIRDAWKTMSGRYRSDVSDMTESMQYRYLEALGQDEVPFINFDAVHEANWEGIFQWGLANLDKSIVKKIEELPASRTQLLRRNDYVFNEVKDVRDLSGYNVVHTIPRKEEVISGTVFGKKISATSSGLVNLGVKNHTEDEESDLDLSRAKSWVMATLLGSATTNAAAIQAKLLTLASTPRKCEAILEKAIKSLQRDKLVSRTHRLLDVGQGDAINESQQFYHLRQYELSARFFEQFDFRRMVTTAMLRRAARYKLDTLDPAFSQGLAVTITKDMVLDDGEMVAILNLFAMGMLRIRPGNDVPASRWGLEWQKHGYTTRLIDKRSLGFSIIISANDDTYIYGDALAAVRSTASAAIPRGEIDQADGMGKIPTWFDITHRFQEGLWEMVLGTILGLVSTRPSISAREIAKTLWYGVSVVEVNMVLDWAEKLHLVKKTAGLVGWESGEWWWFGVGVGGGWNWQLNDTERGVSVEQPQQIPDS